MAKMLLPGPLTLAALNPPVFLLGQNRPAKFQRLSHEQELSQSTVYCILQDHQGFMWFGTQAGLNKYDGLITAARKIGGGIISLQKLLPGAKLG